MEDQIQKIICPVCTAHAVPFDNKEGFTLARCPSCVTIFVTNPPADTTSFYSEGYFSGGTSAGGYIDYDAEKEATRATFVHALTRIEASRPKGKLLDVGAASGYFLALARERGWIVEGIDISPAARPIAAKKGIEVKTGVLTESTYPPNYFDAVTAFDVIEHVSNPKALFALIHPLLSPGGVFFGSTPDAGSMYAKLMGKRWHLICPPEHLVLFSQASLRNALTETQFEVLWTGRIGKRFTLPYIFQTAARWLGLSFLSSVATWIARTPLRRISLPLDFRDNVFFLARRI